MEGQQSEPFIEEKPILIHTGLIEDDNLLRNNMGGNSGNKRPMPKKSKDSTKRKKSVHKSSHITSSKKKTRKA